MRRRGAGLSAMTVLIVLVAAAAPAAELRIGAGSSLALGTNNVDLRCADLTVAGTLLGNSGGLNLARDISILSGAQFQGDAGTYFLTGSWSNQGQFVAGTSSVNFTDGCGQTVSSIAGNTTFFDLEAQSISGKILEFDAGSVTTVTGQVIFAGVPGNRLQIRSSAAGAEAFLDIQGSQIVADVEVQDNHAIGQPILMGTSSAKLGNVNGWWAAYGIPAMRGFAFVVLAGFMLYAGHELLQRREGGAA